MDIIKIRGARTHNLQNINLDLPRNKLLVITGVSGSGKSSLAFDTLYAEGQRRYVESLSAYARQFLQLMPKPDVDLIEGLSPAIAIEQKATNHNPRSTVGTVTEINDYLRLLFARSGTAYCPQHNLILEAQSVSQMVDAVLALPVKTKIMILAPIADNRKGEHIDLFKALQSQGFVRFRVRSGGGTSHAAEAKIYSEELPILIKNLKHTIEVVVDRIVVNSIDVMPDIQQRLAESFETALRLTSGRAIILEMDSGVEHVFSNKFACPKCNYALPSIEPALFSFNNPMGACKACDGLGKINILPYDNQADTLKAHEVSHACPDCLGTRLCLAARHVKIVSNKQDLAIFEINAMSLGQCWQYFDALKLQGVKQEIAARIISEIMSRLSFLNKIGLNYLSLERNVDSLSGGEAQRIRLASQIGSGLTGVMYVLDEPSIGLHQRDNARLILTLEHLRDLGNSVIVVEHDEEMIRASDYVVDIGLGAGIHGGKIIAFGTSNEIAQNAESLTGLFLSGKRAIALPSKRLKPKDNWLNIFGASGNNLHNINAKFPVGLMTCVTGVSGSGKSTLINDTLYPALASALYKSTTTIVSTHTPAAHRKISGLENFDKVINVDQAPIGRTPRSNPATYTGLFTHIRELFASTLTAKTRGYAVGRFSFNVPGGRCDACEGDGVLKIAMHFLPDMYVPCDICQGKRYNRETLEIFYKGKNIHQVLDMTVEAANIFFAAIPNIQRKLQTLLDVGLGYIHLGQSATTLSGGEAQRVKLSLELSKRDTGRTLYILDEPTTGLHFQDIEILLKVIHKLRDHGNTVIVIEHNLDVIKTADWIIDLGPEGGSEGGKIVACGSPEEIAMHAISLTGKYLKPLLN